MSNESQREWNLWGGAEKPPYTGMVEVKYRDGEKDIAKTYMFRWNHVGSYSDIVAWRPVESAEADPYGKDPHQPGAKLDAGKVKAGVLHDFSKALFEVAEVGTYGAEKYTRGGWQSVPNAKERYFDALWRHLLASKHELVDKDTELKHLAHAAWNLLAVLELEARGSQA